MDDFKYRAFISYSWADAKWGKWLHHQLETYRTPPALVDKQGEHGPVRRRLHPIFKDREEEAAGASIGEAVEKALGASEFLIVICSTNSAKSKWVDHEIAWFKTHRDPSKVLALIVDGEPGDPDNNCFPRALTHSVASDLTIEPGFVDAPLAADARITGDGKRGAKLKIAAAMLGVGLDELVNRDERRRTIRTRIVVAASLALAAVMSAMAWFAFDQRDEAREQRAEAEGQIEFMLTDLRERLEPVGRLDVLDAVGERALDYYARQKLSDLDADGLGRRARALLLVGEVSNLRGDSEEALRAFTEAAATTEEQLARDTDNTQRIYDHAQSVFWVGYIAYTRAEMDNAEVQFREYQRLANRLVELEPDNPDWQMEGSYAETNMGVMLREQGRHEEAEPFFARGVDRIEAVAASGDWNAGRQVEVGIAKNWLALTKDSLGKYNEALELFEQETAIYEAILSQDPENAQAKDRLAVALQFLAEQQLIAGTVSAARETSGRSLDLTSELLALEPDSTVVQETMVRGLTGHARYLTIEGRREDAVDSLRRAGSMLSQLLSADPANSFWAGDLTYDLAFGRARLSAANSNAAAAYAHIETARTSLGIIDEAQGRNRAVRLLRLTGDVHRLANRNDEARQAWTDALEQVADDEGRLDERHALLLRLGRRQEAALIAQLLQDQGFRHPEYMTVS